MERPIELPAIEEIAGWGPERCRLERQRLRTELAFIAGDHAHGGPARETFAAALRERLAWLAEKLQ